MSCVSLRIDLFTSPSLSRSNLTCVSGCSRTSFPAALTSILAPFQLLIEAIKQTTLACPCLFWRDHKVARGTCERPVTLSKPGSYLAGKKTETTCGGQSGVHPRLLLPNAHFSATVSYTRSYHNPPPLSTHTAIYNIHKKHSTEFHENFTHLLHTCNYVPFTQTQ